ncbi:DNA-directed RNA polymerase II subunit I [Mrakia frigida]|uniref:DNA-directed RNA polymerase II core subunit RPB9 n=1 Tax=Mrakia frigida TaxID=29902 RepID=UPI003FCBF21B
MASSSQKATTYKYCGNCNNLLYPKADIAHKELLRACRNCDYYEVAERGQVVYRNDLLTITKEQPGVTQDLDTDPTLPRSNIECPHCGHDKAVFYQDQSKRHETRMTLFYVCTECKRNFTDPSLKRGRA